MSLSCVPVEHILQLFPCASTWFIACGTIWCKVFTSHTPLHKSSACHEEHCALQNSEYLSIIRVRLGALLLCPFRQHEIVFRSIISSDVSLNPVPVKTQPGSAARTQELTQTINSASSTWNGDRKTAHRMSRMSTLNRCVLSNGITKGFASTACNISLPRWYIDVYSLARVPASYGSTAHAQWGNTHAAPVVRVISLVWSNQLSSTLYVTSIGTRGGTRANMSTGSRSWNLGMR